MFGKTKKLRNDIEEIKKQIGYLPDWVGTKSALDYRILEWGLAKPRESIWKKVKVLEDDLEKDRDKIYLGNAVLDGDRYGASRSHQYQHIANILLALMEHLKIEPHVRRGGLYFKKTKTKEGGENAG